MKLIDFLFVAIFLAAAPSLAKAETIEDAFSPHQGATELIVKTIGSAHRSIRLAAYGFTSKPIAEALVAAHRRGVDVEAVLDMKANRHSGQAGFLMENGIPVRLNGHYAILHDKFMIIDHEKLELGSFNYTRSAEMRNAENVLVISGNEKLADDYTRQWDKLWNEAASEVALNSTEQDAPPEP